MNSSKENKLSSAVWWHRNTDRAARLKKAFQHSKNLQARAEVNRDRSINKENPTFHGQGYHALGKVRQQKRRSSFRRKMQSQGKEI